MRKAIFTLSFVSLLWADFDKVATTAAPFLKLGVGARLTAMGGSGVALVNDGSALYWNPAGMVATRRMTVLASHNDWLLDIAHDFVSVTVPFRNTEALGFSFSGLTMGDQPVRTLENPEGTGLNYGVLDMAVTAGYARQITDRLAFGLSAKMISLHAYNETAQTFAIDVGSILRTDFHGLQIGMSLSNFGDDLQYAGRDLIVKVDTDSEIDGNYATDATLTTEPWPLPLLIRIGVGMDLLGPEEALLKSNNSRLTLAVDADHPNDGPEHLNLGLEYGLFEKFFFRGGYRYGYDQESWTMGAGFKWDIQGLGKVKMDMAVKPMSVFGETSILTIEVSK